jgi:drug/metabolite transporter (DMT)-like permease
VNGLYLVAGVLAVVTGIVHSLLGERLIFQPLRAGGIVPSLRAPPLRERHVRILWATWHLASVFGWAFAGVLIRLAFPPVPLAAVVEVAIVVAYLGGALLVLWATRGRHPGWIALLAVAVLAWLAAPAG